MKEAIIFTYFTDLPLELSYYPSLVPTTKPAILYFHGGGLIYGHRDDLPLPYIQQLTRAGFPIITFDYPFIPEARLSDILTVLTLGVQWFEEHAETRLNLSSTNFYYFGRSAGGYLALLLTQVKTIPRPEKLIVFYGYYDLTDPELSQPSSYYQTFPSIPFMEYYQLIQPKPIASAQIYQRFPLYLAYRQTGQWIKEMIGPNALPSDYCLTEKDLTDLPPTFLASSTHDQDVPVSITKKMAQLIPETYLHLVSDLPHDFDADTRITAGRDSYDALIRWLN